MKCSKSCGSFLVVAGSKIPSLRSDRVEPGDLAAQPLALCRRVAGHEVLEGVEGLPRRDVVPPVVVQRLHLVVLHVKVALGVPVLFT